MRPRRLQASKDGPVDLRQHVKCSFVLISASPKSGAADVTTMDLGPLGNYTMERALCGQGSLAKPHT